MSWLFPSSEIFPRWEFLAGDIFHFWDCSHKEQRASMIRLIPFFNIDLIHFNEKVLLLYIIIIIIKMANNTFMVNNNIILNNHIFIS